VSNEKNSEEGADDAGVARAFKELRPAMLALAYRITGSRTDAEDIVQNAFLRLHGSRRRRTYAHSRPTSRLLQPG